MAMHVDYTSQRSFESMFKFVDEYQLNMEVIICLGREIQNILYQFVEYQTSRCKILSFIRDQRFEQIESHTMDALCKNIAHSKERIGAIIIDDNCTPLFYKKVREVATAEGAILILQVSNPRNASCIIRNIVPDCLIFQFEKLSWLGCPKHHIKNKINSHQIDGKSIYHLNYYETEFVYDEIFHDQCYSLDNLDLPINSTIFDVGANIGLFSIYCREKLPNASIFAFEPSYAAYQALELNAADFIYKLENTAIHNQSGYKIFHDYRDFSVLSGFHVKPKKDLNTILRGIQSIKNNVTKEDILMTRNRLHIIYSYRCETKTISSVIESNNIKHIDLIKIDTEGSELDILHGIKADYWKKISNFYIETHSQYIKDEIITLLSKFNYFIMQNSVGRLNSHGINTVLAKRVC